MQSPGASLDQAGSQTEIKGHISATLQLNSLE